MSKRKYGSAIGDYLAKRRMEIAQAEAGDKATAQDIEAMAAALADELCQAAKVSPEDYVAIEGGTRTPTPEECSAFAGVLAKHGMDVTAEELTGLLEGDGAAEGEAETMAAEAHAAELAAVRATADAAAAEAQVTWEAQASLIRDLDAKLRAAEATIASNASLVAAGQKYRDERAIMLRKRVAMRHGGDVAKVPAATLATLDAASLDELEVFAGFIGADVLTTPMCAKCGKESAEEYRSSVESVTASGAPRPAHPSKATDMHRHRAVERIRAAAKGEGKTLTYSDALAALSGKDDDEIIRLSGIGQ